mgnify:FL=1
MTRVGGLALVGVMLLGGLSVGAAEEEAPSEEAIHFAEAAVPVKGSEADKALQVQVAARVFDMEHTSRPTCKPKLLNAKIIEPEEDGAWAERWFVRGCNQVLPYRVAFAPDPESGSITFTAMADVGVYGAPTH